MRGFALHDEVAGRVSLNRRCLAPESTVTLASWPTVRMLRKARRSPPRAVAIFPPEEARTGFQGTPAGFPVGREYLVAGWQSRSGRKGRGFDVAGGGGGSPVSATHVSYVRGDEFLYAVTVGPCWGASPTRPTLGTARTCCETA